MAPQIDKQTIETAEQGGGSAIYFFSNNMSDLGKAVLSQPGAIAMAIHICKYLSSLH